MAVFVSSFFAPANPKRPANFVVLKYFLLGLLISNSIESILIIPKILNVMDQHKMQEKELDEVNIKRVEVKELVKEREERMLEKEKEDEREQERMMQVIAKGLHPGPKPTTRGHEARPKTKHPNRNRNKEEEEEEEEREKEHEEGEEEEEEEEEELEKNQHKVPEVRRKPQKKETGTNFVAVFMLFYGSVTLCLGTTAVYKENALLVTILMGVSGVGTVVLISAGFSILMLLSVTKDCLIAGLSYFYRQMIIESDFGHGRGCDSRSRRSWSPVLRLGSSPDGLLSTSGIRSTWTSLRPASVNNRPVPE